MAQEAPESREDDNDGIVVVGSIDKFRTDVSTSGAGFQLPLIETPQAITVIDEDLLRLTGARVIEDVADLVPGLTARATEGAFNRILSRGIDLSNRFGYKLNGIEFQNGTFAIDNVAIDRIESVRGPASIVFGQADYGGIINTVLKSPTARFELEAGVEFGDFDTRRAELSVSGPVNQSGTVRVRLDASYDDRAFFMPFSNRTSQTIHAAAAWDIGPATTLTGRIYYNDLESLSDFGGAIFNGDGELSAALDGDIKNLPRDVLWGAPEIAPELSPGNQSSGYMMLAELEHEFANGIELKLRGSRFDAKRSVRSPYAFYLYDDGSSLIYDYASGEEFETYVFNGELSGEFSLFGRTHRWLLDGYYRTTDNPGEFFRSRYVGTFNAINNVYNIDVDLAFDNDIDQQVNTATDRLDDFGSSLIFLLEPVDRLTILLGGRYQHFSANRETVAPNGTVIQPNVVDFSQGDFVPRVGVTYELADDLFGYVSFSEGIIFSTGILSPENGDGLIPPERGTQYEVGLKGNFFDNRLTAGVTAYRLDRTNVPIADPDDPTGFFSITVPGGRYQGIEVEAIGEPVLGLNILLSYSYQDNSLEPVAGFGTVVPGVPEHQITIVPSYEFLRGPLEGLRIGGSLIHASSRAGNRNQTFDLPAYTRFDLNASYRITENVQLYMIARNITDEAIINITTPNAGAFGVRYEQPRQIFGGVRVSF